MIRSRPFLAGAAFGIVIVFAAIVALAVTISIGTGAAPAPADRSHASVVTVPEGAMTTTPDIPIAPSSGEMTWDPDSDACRPFRTPALDLGWITIAEQSAPGLGEHVDLVLENPFAETSDGIDAEVTATITTPDGDSVQLRSRIHGAEPALVTVGPTAVGDHTVVWDVDGIGFVACHGFAVADR